MYNNASMIKIRPLSSKVPHGCAILHNHKTMQSDNSITTAEKSLTVSRSIFFLSDLWVEIHKIQDFRTINT